jgi:hypothetical protein
MKKITPLLILLCAAASAFAQGGGISSPFYVAAFLKPAAPAGGIALVSSAQDLGEAGGCSVTLNTVGASLLFAVKTFYATETALSDSEAGNVWTLVTNDVNASYSYSILVCTNPTTSATHTFSVPGGGGEGTEYRTLTIYAFSGITGVAVVPGGANIAHNEVGGGGGTSVAPGSVSGKVFVTALSYNVAGTASIDESFNTPLQGAPASGQPLAAASYFINQTSTTKGPTWSKTGANANLASGIIGVSN